MTTDSIAVPGTLAVDGSSALTLALTRHDGDNNAVSGVTVIFKATNLNTTVTPPSGVSNAGCIVSATLNRTWT